MEKEKEKIKLDDKPQLPNLEPETKKRGRPKKETEKEIPPNISKIIISSANGYFKSINLQPLNPLQELLLSIGIDGVIEKYGLDLDSYPELALGASVLWIGYDKYTEITSQRIEDEHSETQSSLFNKPKITPTPKTP